MGKITWIWMCGLYLLGLNQSVLGALIFEHHQLYEGSDCELANGAGEGVCTKLTDCPEIVKVLLAQNVTKTNHCGFSDFEEIVCCEVKVFKKSINQMRPADAACEKYYEIKSKLPNLSFAYVFGGVAAKTREFPCMAALGYVSSDEDAIEGIKYACGGTLISEKHVLTAAHCVSNIQEFVPTEVLLGTINLTDKTSAGLQRVRISRIIKHPEYKRSLNYNDVAILELKNSIEITNYVNPICLITKISKAQGPSLHVLGWGAIDLEGTTSAKLLKASGLQIVDIDECSKSYVNVRAQIPNGLNDKMICVKDPDIKRKADTCWGDSGGPLLMPGRRSLELLGVTSFGQACGSSIPGVYTSVYKYLDWIESHVWPTSDGLI